MTQTPPALSEHDPVLTTLLEITAAQDDTAPQVSIDLDEAGWRSLVREAFRHGVAPRASTRLRDAARTGSIPAWVLHDLQRSYFQAGLDNLRRYGKLAPTLRRFAADGIEVVVLKGAFLADVVYRDRALRPMSDVDLLVRHADLERASALLAGAGWRQDIGAEVASAANTGHQLPTFVQDGVRIEIHWSIEDDDSPFSIDLDGLWRRTQEVLVAGVPTRALAPEDLLLHLCLHTSYSHGWLQFSGGLRHLCDVAETIRHFASEFDWPAFVQRARSWGTGNCVWLALQLARDLVCAAVPATVLAQLAPRDADPKLVTFARDLALRAHYVELAKALPALARVGLTKHSSRLSHAARWHAHLLPDRASLAAAYPSLRASGLLPVRYLAHWADVLRDLGRLALGSNARALLAGERNRQALAYWLESGPA